MTDAPPVLDLRQLTVGYDAVPVVREIDLTLLRGEWCAVVGPNGCGKSALLNTVAGRLPPLTGDVVLAGHSMRSEPRAARSQLGYALPPDALPERLTLRECLHLFTRLHDRTAPAPIVDELLDGWQLRARLDDSVDQSSLGTRQKLGVLLALVASPSLLVLDESFNGLDPRSTLILEEAIEDRLNASDFGVIMATHALELVRRHASKVILIDDGRIAARFDREQIRAAGDDLRALLASRQSNDRTTGPA